MMKNLANILTLARLALLPIMIPLFYLPFAWAAWLCLALYIVGAVTDWLDGFIARKFNQVSAFGTFLDPISDKIFVVTILLMLVATDRITGILVLAVIIILMREFLVAGLREYLGPRNIKLPVTKLAKWKTASQMLATSCLILGPYGLYAQTLGQIGLCIAAVLTVVTGWHYLREGLRHIV